MRLSQSRASATATGSCRTRRRAAVSSSRTRRRSIRKTGERITAFVWVARSPRGSPQQRASIAVVRIGVIVSPAAGFSYAEIRDLARRAEEAGFESFWVSDHFFGGEGVPDRDCLEAWTLLAALARDTTRIRLGCLVAAAQYRNPALLAKTVAGVDQISGGRIEFGIGAGWKENEYRAYGYAFADPGTRVDEMNEAID